MIKIQTGSQNDFLFNGGNADFTHKITVASGIEKPYFKTKFGMTSKGAFIRIGSSTKITVKCSANNATAEKVINRLK